VPPYFDCVFPKLLTSLGIDGASPSGVSQTAAGLSSGKSGALGLFQMTSLAVVLSVVASAFAFFV
jgi:hypothetical protein